MQNQPTESHPTVANENKTEENSIDPKLLALFPPGAQFPIWSPYDSCDAAAMMLEALAEHEKRRQAAKF